MNTEGTDADVNSNPNGATPADANGKSHTVGTGFRSRVKKLLSQFPSRLDEEIRRSPYKTLGVACAVGLGAGVLLSSRILRTVLGSALSYAVVEIARAYLRENATPSDGRKPAGATHAEGRSTQSVA
jgi:hypothetical protein